MTKRVLNREQRRELEGCLATWAEWSRTGLGGYVSAQLDGVRSGEFQSSVPVPPSVDAVESVLSRMSQEYRDGRDFIVWLWLESNVSLTKVERCKVLRVHVSTYDRMEDRAYVWIWNGVVDHGVIVGKKLAA